MLNKKIFRILKDTKIIYSRSKKYNGQCSTSSDAKLAIIYPCSKNVEANKYRFHELFHIALRKLRTIPESKFKNEEEKLVQDITKLIFKRNEKLK
jgi:hypothetical protein